MFHTRPVLVRVLTVVVLLGCACIDYRGRNETAVERLRQQILNEKFDDIYEASSDILKKVISKEEFVKRMGNAADRMRAVDDSLTWHNVPEEHIDRFWDPHEAFSLKEMRGNKERLMVQIHWNSGFKFCGLDYGGDEPGSWVRVVRGCD